MIANTDNFELVSSKPLNGLSIQVSCPICKKLFAVNLGCQQQHLTKMKCEHYLSINIQAEVIEYKRININSEVIKARKKNRSLFEW